MQTIEQLSTNQLTNRMILCVVIDLKRNTSSNNTVYSHQLNRFPLSITDICESFLLC